MPANVADQLSDGILCLNRKWDYCKKVDKECSKGISFRIANGDSGRDENKEDVEPRVK